ncbi:ATP-binding cassette domain-containing protein [Streptomyces sp. NPDC048483]|uniref:ATP-binding cassette domain-containing protein n=1 Tax=Streptomyces sp. NPDC048483 TaxID=3154927 RepID=UPI00341E3F81
MPRRKAVAFQAPRLMPWKRVWRNVLLGLPGRPERDAAVRALEEVGLGHRADAWPRTLSGGEAQRASLSRALVREPDLLLADRALVMEDGRIAYETEVAPPRPRDISDPGFAALRSRLLDRLGVEGAAVAVEGGGEEAGARDGAEAPVTAAPGAEAPSRTDSAPPPRTGTAPPPRTDTAPVPLSTERTSPHETTAPRPRPPAPARPGDGRMRWFRAGRRRFGRDRQAHRRQGLADAQRR